MNRKQMQLNVCKALLDGNTRCRGHRINDNEYAVTTDGFTAYVFDIQECIFDVSRITDLPYLTEIFKDDEKDVEIKKSNDLFEWNGKVLEKYTAENTEIYVDSKLSKQFAGFYFFTNSSNTRILVKDSFGRKMGLFLPVRYPLKK